jgi:transcription elongation factor Elf1
LTFYYCNEKEKYFRTEELIRFLKEVDSKEKYLPILLMTFARYGDENMTIKIFEIIKDLKYGEFACFTQKFKSDTKLKWDQKKMNIANTKLILSYFRDQNADDKELTEVKAIDYDIKWIQKRTFRTGIDPIENENITEKEKISFEPVFKCNHCGKESKLTRLIHNFNTLTKENFLVCLKCKKNMEPEIEVIYDKIKNKFKIYSPIKLLSVAKEIFMEYGPRIDLDELRNKYNSFFWNCVFYFFQNGLSIEMTLKYKAKEALNSIPKKEKEKITKK